MFRLRPESRVLLDIKAAKERRSKASVLEELIQTHLAVKPLRKPKNDQT